MKIKRRESSLFFEPEHELHPIQVELTPHLFKLATLPPTWTGMSDIGKSKVNYLEGKRPFLAQYVPGRKVPVCNAQIMDGTPLRTREVCHKKGQHNALQITTSRTSP